MAKRVEDLLAQREGSAIDFKLDASSPKGIVKDFVAFSNAAGGAILIGVDDARKVVGLDDPQGTEEAIAQAIYSSTEPKQSPRISVLTQDEKELVLIEAQYFQGAEPLQLRDGSDYIVYERVGSNSMPVTDDERLEQIRRERRGRDGFDQLAAVGSTLEDLDMEAIVEAFAARDIDIDESKLESYELGKRENGQLVPTNAGILLFGKNPSDFLSDAYFRGIRYPGASKGNDAAGGNELRVPRSWRQCCPEQGDHEHPPRDRLRREARNRLRKGRRCERRGLSAAGMGRARAPRAGHSEAASQREV